MTEVTKASDFSDRIQQVGFVSCRLGIEDRGQKKLCLCNSNEVRCTPERISEKKAETDHTKRILICQTLIQIYITNFSPLSLSLSAAVVSSMPATVQAGDSPSSHPPFKK